MQGQFPRNLDEKLVDKEVISVAKRWRRQGRAESTVLAAQDQASSTNCFERRS
jgi:hypothetical protein